ncbi:MAG: hypothetical protein ACHP7O_08595 [Burkholderiales bacterium]
MLNHALFAIMEEAGTAVMILSENVELPEFLASRLTRAEVQRQLRIMASAMGSVPAATRLQLPELEWDGWDRLGGALQGATADAKTDLNDAVWFAVRSLTPATLIWLQIYRKNQPELFTLTI